MDMQLSLSLQCDAIKTTSQIKEKTTTDSDRFFLVETPLTTWNQIRRELIVAAEIYQSMRIAYLIENK